MARKRANGLTPRQREWLSHLRACQRDGESIRGYAKRRRLSEHAMYQASKELRKRGVLAAGGSRRPSKPRPTFVQVSPVVATAPPAWRARLPNGVVLEGAGALGRELLEALARL